MPCLLYDPISFFKKYCFYMHLLLLFILQFGVRNQTFYSEIDPLVNQLSGRCAKQITRQKDRRQVVFWQICNFKLQYFANQLIYQKRDNRICVFVTRLNLNEKSIQSKILSRNFLVSFFLLPVAKHFTHSIKRQMSFVHLAQVSIQCLVYI